jgi:hypothetical protein
MTLADIPPGASVFVDANIFVFALNNHAVHGAACNVFLDRAETRKSQQSRPRTFLGKSSTA